MYTACISSIVSKEGNPNYAIPSGGEHIDAAWEFLQWFATEQTEKMVPLQGVLPIKLAAFDAWLEEQKATYPVLANIELVRKAVLDSRHCSYGRRWSEWHGPVYRAMIKDVMLGNVELAQALRETKQKIEVILNE